MPIVVEGKYDKITLENVVDTLIIATDGFTIFKNEEKRQMLRALAQRNGIIVMTDSDSAGNLIRGYIKKIVGDSRIINVYIPRIQGKEKRKKTAGKEGVLGLEGMSREVIENCLKVSGVGIKNTTQNSKKIQKLDLFKAGLSGREQSSEKRKKLLKYLELPTNLSPNAMLDILNTIYTYDEFSEVIEKWQTEETES
ncbi:MAG: DUF4093 domain-containing protein [Clostridia bacterium]|nr:DUF4093 domain-containing protein [Clostridia bacterium]